MSTDGPELTLNMGGRRDTSCRIPCDTQRAEDGRVLDNTYEYERNESISDQRRCLRNAYDGILKRMWEGWQKGTTAGGFLSPPPDDLPSVPPYLPLTECCVPPPTDPNVSCADDDIRTCMLNCCCDGRGGTDPRRKIQDEVLNAHLCSVASCYMLSPVNGREAQEGAPPPYNGPNWCIDDTQKQIDEQILDLKQLACVEEQCEGPINRNCPDRHPVLNEICRLEALKRARCDMFEIEMDYKNGNCVSQRDYVKDLMDAYSLSCWATFDERNPCGEDLPTEEALALGRCIDQFFRRELLLKRRRNRTRIRLLIIRNDRMSDRLRQYDAEVAACSCSGQSDTSGFPELYPNWFRDLRDLPQSLPAQWESPLSPYTPTGGNGDMDEFLRNLQRFWRDLVPLWLPLPSYMEEGRTPSLPED